MFHTRDLQKRLRIVKIQISRILQDISPIVQKSIEVCKRAKQVRTLLTQEEYIKTRKNVAEKSM